MDLNSLPTEMFLHILSYLNPSDLCGLTGQVCREWQALSYNSMLWRNVILDGRLQSKHEIHRVAVNSSLSRSFSFSNISDWTFTLALPKCIYVRKIELNSCALDQSSVSQLVAALPFVENLSLDISQDLDCDVIREIMQWVLLKAITIIAWKSEKKLDSSNWLSLMTDTCKHLEYLDMQYNLFVDDSSIINFTISHGATLKTLLVDTNKLSANGYRFISNCPNLRQLVLNGASNMTADELMNLRQCEFLEKLVISDPVDFTATDFINLLKGHAFLNLVHLSLHVGSCVNDRGIELISTNCPSLKNLELSGCRKVTDKGMKHIVNNARNIVSLSISGSDLTGSCFAEIFKMTKLVYLDLSGCAMIKIKELVNLKMQKPNLHIDTNDLICK